MHKYRLPISQVLSWRSWSFAEQSISFNVMINSSPFPKQRLSKKTIWISGGSPLFSQSLASCWSLLLNAPSLSSPIPGTSSFQSYCALMYTLWELSAIFRVVMPPSSASLTCISCEDVISFLPAVLHCFLQQLLDIPYSIQQGPGLKV